MEIVVPSEKYYASYAKAAQEYVEKNITTRVFFVGTWQEVEKHVESCRTGVGLPQNYVLADYFWLVDGEEFIGEISVRHKLTDELLRFGGHIGYGVRYSQWGKGHASYMLAYALRYAKQELGLSRVLITCNDKNVASARVIEKNGGVLQDKIINVIEGRECLSRRYWIELTAAE